jgi:hypothetical protein
LPEPKLFWAVQGAGHVDLEAYAPADYRRIVLPFLVEHLQVKVGADGLPLARRRAGSRLNTGFYKYGSIIYLMRMRSPGAVWFADKRPASQRRSPSTGDRAVAGLLHSDFFSTLGWRR